LNVNEFDALIIPGGEGVLQVFLGLVNNNEKI